jgi:hypothetical protein
MAPPDLGMNARHRLAGARWARRAVWISPYVLVWVMAAVVLRVGALSADCTTVCLVARGWLWYTVFYATVSLSAFVGAIEVLVWMLHLRPAGRPQVSPPRH